MTKLHNALAAGVAAVFFMVALPSIASAEVTVLGWPGGSEEAALRASVDAYNALPGTAGDDKVQLLFFNRDGFYDKLQADLAAGSDAFDINLIATYSIGRYAPFMEPVDLGADAEKVFGKTFSRRCSLTASSMECLPTCRSTSCTTARISSTP